MNRPAKLSHTVSLIAGLLAAASLTACGGKTKPGKIDYHPGIALPADAVRFELKSAKVHPRVDVMGTVVGATKATVGARIPASVVEVFASAGQSVNNGELLVRLDDREIREQFDAATAMQVQAEAEWRRTLALFEKQAATEQQKLAAETAARAAKSQVERARVMLSYADVRSPIDGVVTDRQVNPGDFAGPGQPLLAVYDPRRVRLEVPVPLRLVDLAKVGGEVDVTLNDADRVLRAKIVEIVSEADPVSRTRKVKIDLPADAAQPGAFGRMWLDLPERDMLLAPVTAIYRMGQLEFVQVVQDGRAVRRLVKTGPHHGEQVEILSGIAIGDTILAKPVLTENDHGV